MSDSLPSVWRVHLRPGGGPESSGGNAVRLCLDQGVIGIGWQVDPAPKSPEEYWEAGNQRFGNRGWKTNARAILWRMAVGDFVWFRDTRGDYYLGRVSGEWEYRDDKVNRDVDIANVRRCSIHKVGTGVPGKIVSAFIRGPALRPIRDDTARLFSIVKFNELSGETVPTHRTDGDIFSLLSAMDLEDLTGIYLQRRHGLLLIPSSRQRNSTTIDYEFELVDPDTGSAAYVQVKSGNERLDPARYYGDSADGAPDRKYFLFSPAGYERRSERPEVVCIPRTEMEAFLAEARRYLPGNIRTWLDWLDLISGTDAG